MKKNKNLSQQERQEQKNERKHIFLIFVRIILLFFAVSLLCVGCYFFFYVASSHKNAEYFRRNGLHYTYEITEIQDMNSVVPWMNSVTLKNPQPNDKNACVEINTIAWNFMTADAKQVSVYVIPDDIQMIRQENNYYVDWGKEKETLLFAFCITLPGALYFILHLILMARKMIRLWIKRKKHSDSFL